jgi:hypothetical protein
VAAQHPFAPRATRYAIPVSVLYRPRGEKTWFEGRTENISKSGVLVRSDQVLAPNTPVEMLINIPAEISSPFAGTTICRGRIVRALGPSALEDRPAWAAAIIEYESSHVVDPRRI